MLFAAATAENIYCCVGAMQTCAVCRTVQKGAQLVDNIGVIIIAVCQRRAAAIAAGQSGGRAEHL